ncbi:hypothetical protein SAMN02745121_09144 [Nannocystis exedens]|uniref:Uncharacterized protein n=1 Tax=Nannocystis exedens TaxID=54 RepID=A0A1I2J1G8_9BACT|nr:hypothetical protein [Nannocystis exedens]PCC74656.1 hypothetical protein NAEX_07753 [Nannocystis exedens]SFF48572.1 hypothetical protein SAMN02745121_09144 [Nannocystis exedens]
MPTKRTPDTALMQTIDRDARVLACDLLRNLCDLLRGVLDDLLLGGPHLDVQQLQESVEYLVVSSRYHGRALNNARITRRGTIRRTPSENVPEPARPFLRLGSYMGAFRSHQLLAVELGQHTAAPAPARPEPGGSATPAPDDRSGRFSTYRRDLTGAAIDAHLHGDVWTIDIDGQVHAFRPHSGGSDEP